MSRLRSIWRMLKMLTLTAGCWAAVHGTAAAQDGQERSGGSYVLPYFLVIFGIALGMLVVCHTSRRLERARPEQYGD